MRERIATEKAEGARLTTIAADLNGDGTPTAQGGQTVVSVHQELSIRSGPQPTVAHNA